MGMPRRLFIRGHYRECGKDLSAFLGLIFLSFCLGSWPASAAAQITASVFGQHNVTVSGIVTFEGGTSFSTNVRVRIRARSITGADAAGNTINLRIPAAKPAIMQFSRKQSISTLGTVIVNLDRTYVFDVQVSGVISVKNDGKVNIQARFRGVERADSSLSANGRIVTPLGS